MASRGRWDKYGLEASSSLPSLPSPPIQSLHTLPPSAPFLVIPSQSGTFSGVLKIPDCHAYKGQVTPDLLAITLITVYISDHRRIQGRQRGMAPNVQPLLRFEKKTNIRTNCPTAQVVQMQKAFDFGNSSLGP